MMEQLIMLQVDPVDKGQKSPWHQEVLFLYPIKFPGSLFLDKHHHPSASTSQGRQLFSPLSYLPQSHLPLCLCSHLKKSSFILWLFAAIFLIFFLFFFTAVIISNDNTIIGRVWFKGHLCIFPVSWSGCGNCYGCNCFLSAFIVFHLHILVPISFRWSSS